MDHVKTLVVYYSRSGHTADLAHAIARELGADLEPLLDDVDRGGVLGYLRSGYEAFTRKHIELRELRYDPSDYDLVLVGTPNWGHALSSPVRAYLETYGCDGGSLGFFLTEGGSGEERVFRQMTDAAGRAPVISFAVREREVDAAHVQSLLARLVATLASAGTNIPHDKTAKVDVEPLITSL